MQVSSTPSVPNINPFEKSLIPEFKYTLLKKVFIQIIKCIYYYFFLNILLN